VDWSAIRLIADASAANDDAAEVVPVFDDDQPGVDLHPHVGALGSSGARLIRELQYESRVGSECGPSL
jgi:hypothetical protein